MVHRSAGNIKENIRTPDLLCRKTAECPVQVDGRVSRFFSSRLCTRHLDFILAYFIETGDFVLCSTYIPFLTRILFCVPDQVPRKCSDTDHCREYQVSIQQIKIPLRAERTYELGRGGDRKYSLKRLILRMHMMHFIV